MSLPYILRISFRLLYAKQGWFQDGGRGALRLVGVGMSSGLGPGPVAGGMKRAEAWSWQREVNTFEQYLGGRKECRGWGSGKM